MRSLGQALVRVRRGLTLASQRKRRRKRRARPGHPRGAHLAARRLQGALAQPPLVLSLAHCLGPQFRLELPLDTPVQETPLSVKLSKVRPAVRAWSLASHAPRLQQSGELKIHLALLQQGVSTRAASSPLASAAPERQPDFEAQPASPSASAAHAEAETLAREAMSAVQAEDLTLAQQLMAKAALLWPSEYAEALELIEAAQRSVGAEADAPVEPVPAVAEPAASPDAGANAPPATPPPESGGGSSRKHKSKRGRTPAAATPPATAPPAAAEPEPAAGGTEEEVDMDALYQHLTLEVVAAAVWQVWTEFLTEYLPLVADAIGWADGEGYVRGALAAESPVRGKVLACATAVVLVLGCLAVAALLLISRRALGVFANALSFCWQFAAAILRGITWEPVWYMAWPACVVARLQTRVPIISAFWAAPAWWWLLGGRMWALLGSVLCFGSLIILGRGNYFISVCGWTLLRGACAFRSWWLRIPAGLIVLAAWVFCWLAWLQALVDAEANRDSTRPGELSVDVPKDAEGEVARILGCRTYYEVLEVGEDTDEESVRKAHRRKALLVHPDKCSSPHAKAAFQRVQDGFILLKGAPNSCGLTRTPFAHATVFKQTRHRSASTTIFFQGRSPCKLPALPPMQATRARLGRGTGSVAEEAGAET